MRYLSFLFILMIFTAACTSDEIEELTDYPNSHLLIEAEELFEKLRTENILLIDAREETGDTLLPGATHFAAISELTEPDYAVDHFLIGPDTFQEKMRGLGLNYDSRVVIYDDGNHLSAARLFYALDYYGFSNTSLLHGGLQSWLAHDLPLGTDFMTNQPGNFSFDAQEARFCDFEYIVEAANSPDKIVFDVRSADEYTGEDKRAEFAGHIPNAVNLEWNKVLETDGIPYFLPAREIQRQYTELGITPDKEVIPHCHTNVRGSHAYFTLRLMGYDSVRPYEGSWSEYGNRPDAIVQ
ncbi:MAG: sulfurtransferase [Balneolaceae bacterium]|nr:sulfurtransferase [Balneolaceae bacterium]